MPLQQELIYRLHPNYISTGQLGIREPQKITDPYFIRFSNQSLFGLFLDLFESDHVVLEHP
jgi:hypothetical protein